MSMTAQVALSYQTALSNQLDIVANNIANVSTNGFQGSRPIFAEYLSDTTQAGSQISYVEDAGTIRDIGQGPLRFSGNKLDLALQGEGYFVIEEAGEYFYTRDGTFRLDESGRLITSSGAVVLDDDEKPIVISPEETQIDIDRNGTIRTENGEIGRIWVVTFPNQQDMEALGGNRFRTEQVPIDAANTEVVQGMLENSNVVAIVEMTRMIELLRSYQAANQLITAEENREKDAIEVLTRTV